MPSLVEPVVNPATLPAQLPEIRVQDLTLRAWSTDDAKQLVTIFDDREIQRWHLFRLDSEDEARDLVLRWREAWNQRTSARWAVVHSATPDIVLGQVAFRALYLEDGMAECSYWTAPEWRQKGIASAAVNGLASWALNDLGLERLELVHSVRNRASCRVAGAAGFDVEGVKLKLQRHTDGMHDMHLHSRVRAEPTTSTGHRFLARTRYTLATVRAAASGIAAVVG
jgi:ribosomal-protein-alanine N-acetyltransferase